MPRIKIVSNGHKANTKVYADGEDITGTVSKIVWEMSAQDGVAHITIETTPLIDAELEGEIDG